MYILFFYRYLHPVLAKETESNEPENKNTDLLYLFITITSEIKKENIVETQLFRITTFLPKLKQLKSCEKYYVSSEYLLCPTSLKLHMMILALSLRLAIIGSKNEK